MTEFESIQRLTRPLGIRIPLICGPMYPCSNPELVAAVSEAGGMGVVQPLSLTYVYGYEFRAGLRKIKSLTQKPFGMNALIEKSSKRYLDRMSAWIDCALEEGVRFFITSLGNPGWVVDRVHRSGGIVYHDATERKWALKGVEAGVDGLIAVNNRAGGHAGKESLQYLYESLGDLNLPVVAAGGIGSESGFIEALRLGYSGVQMGTRFIATTECQASQAYKQAILKATSDDIVLSERLTGIPVSVIRTPYVTRKGLHPGWLARRLLKGNRSRHLIRLLYTVQSLWKLRQDFQKEKGEPEYWQAGKSVDDIHSVESASAIVKRLDDALQRANRQS